jgi:hypothetical protein
VRDVLGMTRTKFGCGQALCGACSAHVDGAATRSCITTVDSIGESAITTIKVDGERRHRAMVHSELPISVLFHEQDGAHLFAMINGLCGSDATSISSRLSKAGGVARPRLDAS